MARDFLTQAPRGKNSILLGSAGDSVSNVVCRLSQLTVKMQDRAGGKAAGLSRILRLDGIRVPEGFVIMPNAETDTLEVQTAILDEFDRLNAEKVAVRSSALQEDGAEISCAGLFETFLDVERVSLLQRIEDVRRSAIEVHESEPTIAVVVQPMLAVQIAGVCFSVNPVGQPDEMLIEAVEGLGEALVSGLATPQRYRISRKTLEIHKERSGGLSSGNVLISPDQLRELTDVTMRLEEAEGHPVDVEWAFSFGVLYILQCRPITATAMSTSRPEGAYRYIWASSEPMWMMELGLMTRAGILPDDYDTATMWDLDDIFYAKYGAIYEYFISEADLVPLRSTLPNTVQILEKAEEAWLRQDEIFESMVKVSPSELNSSELLSFFNVAARFYCDHIGLYSASSSLVTGPLEEKLRAVLTIEEQLTLMRTLDPDLMEVEQADWATLVVGGQFSRSIALRHVRAHPFVALNLNSEELIVETLRLLFTEARGRLLTTDLPQWQSKTALKNQQSLILDRHPDLRETVAILHRMSASRMRIKRGWAGLGFFMIPFFEEVASRSGESVTDITIHYRFREIERLIMTGERLDAETTRQRAIACLWRARKGEINFLEGAAARVMSDELMGSLGGGTIQGFVASEGTARGRVRIVHCNEPESLRQARQKFCDGEILVTEMAQPSMLDLISRSGAVITNEGGLLSHAAIVTRERGIPCVVGTGTAKKDLVDGEIVELRAAGEIVRIDP